MNKNITKNDKEKELTTITEIKIHKKGTKYFKLDKNFISYLKAYNYKKLYFSVYAVLNFENKITTVNTLTREKPDKTDGLIFIKPLKLNYPNTRAKSPLINISDIIKFFCSNYKKTHIRITKMIPSFFNKTVDNTLFLIFE